MDYLWEMENAIPLKLNYRILNDKKKPLGNDFFWITKQRLIFYACSAVFYVD